MTTTMATTSSATTAAASSKSSPGPSTTGAAELARRGEPSPPALQESTLDPAEALYSEVIPAGNGWSREILAGQVLRIVDLEGNQAVDTLFFNAAATDERYSAPDTITAQKNIYLTTGSVLMSTEGRPMLTIVADTCGRHDTLGGACSAESNQVRYALEKKYMHSCRDSFLLELGRLGRGMGKRDLPSNINFFMNVPVTPEGGLSFADGLSAPGRYVEMRAEMNVLALISNCPQLNNPCNGYHPTPVRVLIWDAPAWDSTTWDVP
jgi:urea carboxylase-associated protein 1